MALPPLHRLSDLYSSHIHYIIYSTPFQWAGSALLVSRNEFLRLQMDVLRGRLQDFSRMPPAKSGSAQTVLIVSWQGNRFTSVERLRVFHFFQQNPLRIFFR